MRTRAYTSRAGCKHGFFGSPSRKPVVRIIGSARLGMRRSAAGLLVRSSGQVRAKGAVMCDEDVFRHGLARGTWTSTIRAAVIVARPNGV